MGIALNTSALIAIERGGREYLDEIPAEIDDIFVPALVLAELWIGVELAETRRRRERRARKIEILTSAANIIAFDERVAPTYAAIYAELRRTGAMIPANDLAIGSLAVHGGHTLLVGPEDEAHFRKIPRLDVQVLGGG